MAKANSRTRKKYNSKKIEKKTEPTPVASSLTKIFPFLLKIPALGYAAIIKGICFIAVLMIGMNFCLSAYAAYMLIRIDGDPLTLLHTLPPAIASIILLFLVLRLSVIYSKWKYMLLNHKDYKSPFSKPLGKFTDSRILKNKIMASITLIAFSAIGIHFNASDSVIYVAKVSLDSYEYLVLSFILTIVCFIPKFLIEKKGEMTQTAYYAGKFRQQ